MIATVISVIAAFIVGNYLDRLKNRVVLMEQVLAKKVKRDKQREEQGKSTLIDMDDPIELAKWEHEEMLRQLNPQSYPEDES